MFLFIASKVLLKNLSRYESFVCVECLACERELVKFVIKKELFTQMYIHILVTKCTIKLAQ